MRSVESFLMRLDGEHDKGVESSVESMWKHNPSMQKSDATAQLLINICILNLQPGPESIADSKLLQACNANAPRMLLGNNDGQATALLRRRLKSHSMLLNAYAWLQHAGRGQVVHAGSWLGRMPTKGKRAHCI